MCHWHWHFTENLFLRKYTQEASHRGGLPLCSIGTGISLIFLQNSHSWGFSMRWTAFMYSWHRHFTENLFWQNSLMRILIEVDCPYVPLALTFHWFIFLQNSHSWGFSMRWTAFMYPWHRHFTENLFWQNSLMRLLIQVDCLYVPLALAFHWKYFLAKLSASLKILEINC